MAVTLSPILLSLIAVCIFSWIGIAVAANSLPAQTSELPSFDWSALKPSPDLIWHECYSAPSPRDGAQRVLSPPTRKLSCARLTLPLDYHNTTNSHNVSTAVIKASSPPSPSHRGTIFLAFGGAGNSRVLDLVSLLSRFPILDFLDPDSQYDFVTFDNRGFGYSSPSARCFDSVLDGTLWEERMADLGGIMSTDDDEALNVRFVAAKAKGELCAQKVEGDDDIRRHMTTPYAARDMLEILKRLEHSAPDPSFPGTNGEATAAKLQFLGASYGTIVGQMFATLYPEHVSRMVLDGAADPRDWMGKWQMKHLHDVDPIWASVLEDCFKAKEDCPLWQASDSMPADIERRVSEFIEDLARQPAYTVSEGNARLVSQRDVRIAIYWLTLSPAFSSTELATALDGLMKGQTNVSFPFEGHPAASDYPGNESQEGRAASNVDAGLALNCGDGENITNVTVADFREYLSALETLSSEAAFFQGERRVRCTGWPIQPAWRFTGPFNSRWENGSSKLSTPILFTGNRLDPMTRLQNAWEVVDNYPGSVVLEQDSRGHCVFGGFPDRCILEHVRKYFFDGTLPQQGTVCGEDCNVFDGSCFDEERLSSAEDFLLKRSLGY